MLNKVDLKTFLWNSSNLQTPGYSSYDNLKTSRRSDIVTSVSETTDILRDTRNMSQK